MELDNWPDTGPELPAGLPAGLHTGTTSPTGLPSGITSPGFGDFQQTNIPNLGNDPDTGPPTQESGIGSGMRSGDGLGIGCLTEISNFLDLGSLESYAQSIQSSDYMSSEGPDLTRFLSQDLGAPGAVTDTKGELVVVRQRHLSGLPGAWGRPGLSQIREGVVKTQGSHSGGWRGASEPPSAHLASPAGNSTDTRGVGGSDGETSGKQSDRKEGGLIGRHGENRLGAWGPGMGPKQPGLSGSFNQGWPMVTPMGRGLGVQTPHNYLHSCLHLPQSFFPDTQMMINLL